jgi:hypothetical protein
MERSRVDIEVAYPAGYTPALFVNDSPVSSDRIGTTSVLPSRGVAAARYVGVPLEEGANRIRLQATPPDGNAGLAQTAESLVILPGPAVGLRLSVPDGRWVADGQTPGVLRIQAIDSESRRTVTREVVTLTVEGARPMGMDLDPEDDGFQVRLSRGEAVVKFAPLLVPGQVQASATAGEMEQELVVTVVPAAGEWRVFGLAEGRLAGDGGVEGDGGMPTGLDDGISESGARLAVMARGPVGNSSRLIVSVDTDREPHEDRLFDFAPDAFYPVSGDTSVRLDEAQTQGKVFARLDAPAGYLQWGDFTSPMTRNQLSRFDRRLNGLSGEGQWGRFGVSGFAAPTEQHQVRDVFAPDGTSGPYLLSARPVVARSEKLFIETRDRFRLEKVLAREVKLRDVDYSLDPVAGTILFRGPVAPFDADFNPVRVVVLYEYHGDDEKQVAAGTRVSYRPVETFEAGASAVYVERVGDPQQLIGVDLGWQPGASTSLRAEAASSDNGEQTATAYRLDVASRPTATLALEAIYQELPLEFENPSLLDSPDIGTRKASAGALWEPSESWRLKGELLDSDDERIDLSQTVAAIETERRFSRLSVMGALRGVKSDGPVSGDISSALVEAGIQGKLSSRWTGSLIRRQVVTDEAAPNYPTRTQIGVSYQIREGALAFLRHEIESGGLVNEDRTLVGIESRIGKHTKSFARYALQEGNAGSSLRATTGVETVLPLSPASTLNLMVSRLDTTKGIDTADFTTLAAGYEHRYGTSLASGRYEVRLGAHDTRHLLTAAVAWRPPGAWTYFGRERVSFLDPDTTSGAIRAEGLFGLAYRPLGRMWRFLSRLEHSTASGVSTSAGGVTPGIPAVAGLIPDGLGIERPRQDPAVTHDSVAVVFAAGARVTPMQRLGATLTFRLVDDGTIPQLPATLTDLLSLHYTATVHRRWTVGGSLRRFAQEDMDEISFGAGIEVGYLALKNLWLTGGYNVLGFSAPGFPGAEHTDSGPFMSFRFKFDEANLVPWRDTRLDHP